MNGAQLAEWGLSALHGLRSPRGFQASDAESGLYPAMYGRDSLWVVLLLLEAEAMGTAAGVSDLLIDSGATALSTLAALQGTTTEDTIEEQPGRIVHEYHEAPSPHAKAMGLPLVDGRSYGGFDETFLFVLACDAFARAHSDHPALPSLKPSVDRALDWMDRVAGEHADGLFAYRRRHPANLLNQVWKDSFDSATHTGFDVPTQPLAWLEVQAYAYAILGGLSPASNPGAASPARDRERADALARRVDEAFWLNDEEGFAMALDGDRRPVRMVASNQGHALWAGIVGEDRSGAVIERMLRPDLMSDYGLRTLSRDSPYYAPFAYHRGAIWPFDNAVFALALLRHRREADAVRVARAAASALARAGSALECYSVVEPDLSIDGALEDQLLCWRRFPPQNRVQAFTAAALVVFGTLIEAG